MPSQDTPPFERGQTMPYLVGEDPNSTVDPAGGTWHEGQEFYFNDKDFIGAVGQVIPDRSAKLVIARIMRNVSAATLAPKTLCKHNTTLHGGATATPTAAEVLGQTSGPATAAADLVAGVVDEHLSPIVVGPPERGGVPANHLFWCVRDGLTRLVAGAGGLGIGGGVSGGAAGAGLPIATFDMTTIATCVVAATVGNDAVVDMHIARL